MSKSKVMLVDDHVLLRAGIRALVEQQDDMEIIAEAGNFTEALELACQHRPDLIILDLNMPGGPNISLVKRLEEFGLATRVLVLSMHDDPAYARAAIAAGAMGYIVKTISEQDLLMAIRSVRKGHLIVDLDSEVKTASVFATPQLSPRSRGEALLAKLSERETEVLILLGQGHSNQAVSERLDISPKTVATYKMRIGEKLGLTTTPEFVRFVADTGLVAKNELPR